MRLWPHFDKCVICKRRIGVKVGRHCRHPKCRWCNHCVSSDYRTSWIVWFS